ncbi:condensation domain-containing protein [Deinococcus maricopensis]|uniref:Condensation domain protein n=1 Tax=Deinococcus maricopensis (strain DSM 21211 / LMG 22137 / NRRL B-23946 / LB-34) TaxID=709986 RepID=E8U3H7_DEIML|nr:condensation domain-containing protein [Deinococcus maricopensis]ADV65848.1 condensation domain protein [Deinococcus maricopensis DSM 21211]
MTLTGTLPLTAAQRSLWAEQQAHPDHTLNHTADCTEVRGPLQRDAFERALHLTMLEAEALRARLDGPGERGVQHPGAAAPTPMTLVDLRGTPNAAAHAETHLRAHLDAPFDLTRGHLTDHTLYVLADDHHWWVMRTHHIALDGYGVALFGARVAEHYRALTGGPAVGAPFAAYAPVVAEDAAYATSAARQADRAYWMKLYADIPHTPAPLLDLGLARGTRVTGDLSAEDVRALRACADALRTPWPNLLFAATAAYWRARTGERHVFLAVPSMARLGSVAARVPCLTMNLLPLRVNAEDGASLADLAGQADAAYRAARPHARYRYEDLWADLNGHRLFGPEVNVIPFAAPLNLGAALQVRTRNVASGPVEDLAFAFTGWAERLTFALDGHPRLYDAATLQAHHAAFLAGLMDGVRHPHRSLVFPAVRA